MEAQGSGKLPSQKVTNPNENVSAITLKGGKQLEEVQKKVASEKKKKKKMQKKNLPRILDEANP